MNRFLAAVFAYMLSISSAFAVEVANNTPFTPESVFADIIANDKGVKPQDLRVIITKGTKELQAASQMGIRVLSMKIDTSNDNFSAMVAAGVRTQFEVKGKFEKIRLVPILSRNFKKNEIITASDITYTGVTEKQFSRYVTDEKALAGKVAARDIAANRPILPSLVTEEKIISKGAVVTAVYKSELMQLSDSVEAMEDGALGQTIRLKNTNSSKIIRGKVTAANTVELTSTNQFASN